MIEQFDFVNNLSVRLSFNVASPYAIPLHDVKFEQNMRNERRTKSQRHGRWPGRLYMDETLVHMDGEIIDSDSTGVNAALDAVVSTILPDPTVFPVTETKLGQLEIKMTGQTETFFAECTIDGDIDAPREGLYPSKIPLSIVWVIPQGYMVGMDTAAIWIPK